MTSPPRFRGIEVNSSEPTNLPIDVDFVVVSCFYEKPVLQKFLKRCKNGNFHLLGNQMSFDLISDIRSDVRFRAPAILDFRNDEQANLCSCVFFTQPTWIAFKAYSFSDEWKKSPKIVITTTMLKNALKRKLQISTPPTCVQQQAEDQEFPGIVQFRTWF